MEIRVNEKGQIIIPAKLRKKYGIKTGTRFIISDTGNSIIIKPITDQYFKNIQGSLKGKGSLQILMEERRKD